MDLVFKLGNGDRVSCLLHLMHSLGCSYICLWTYSPDIKFLYCEEGHFQEDEVTTTQVASSSSGTSFARKLFETYRQSFFTTGNQSQIPGLAFKNRKPYLELQEVDLQRLASIDIQRHFYLEARIKVAVFLGCERGEIELGMPYIPQNMEISIQNLFPQAFTKHQPSQVLIEQTRPSPPPSLSPSPSLSMENSPETYSQLFYTLPNSTTNTQTIPILNQFLNNNIIPFPSPEITDAALTRAYLAILSSNSINIGQEGGVSRGGDSQMSHRKRAFTSYHHHQNVGMIRPNRQSLFKRVILYYRGINYRRIQEHTLIHGNRPSNTQLHHMISERRRREKINDSFQALRSLLPQGTKKDKASVLRTTKEYLSTLKTQLQDLIEKNQLLEAQLKMKKEPTTTTIQQDVSTNDQLPSIQIIPVSESTSRERLVDLHVRVSRGDDTLMTDLVMSLLEFINQTRVASLVSMEAQIVGEDHTSINLVSFRLRIEGDEWEETGFKEAVRRILPNLGPSPN